MKAIPCPISAEELRRLVHGEQLTDKQIAARLPGGTPKRVLSWRRRFKVEALPRWQRGKEVAPIEGALKSILVGSMLGDGRLVRRPNTTHYSESHCGEQRAYLEWKAQFWEGWEAKITDVPDKRGYEQVRLRTCSHGLLNPWHDCFYPGVQGWKRLPPEVVGHVDELALAIWYLDDGHAGWWPGIIFGADDSSREVAWAIFNKFGLRPRWQLHSGKTGTFHMEPEDTADRFLGLIREHVPECMGYKVESLGFQGPHFQVRQKLDPEKLAALAAEGVPIRRIGRMLGVGGSTVSRHLHKWGIAHPRKTGRPAE